MRAACLLAVSLALLSACASPDAVGQRVGRSLYDASVDTGHALAVAGDRTGQAIQNAGSNLRNAVNPPLYPPPPPPLPPPYVPGGFDTAPVTTAPLAPPGYGPSQYDPYRDGPDDTMPANPARGY
jgi:hypothetical protein